MQLSGVIKNLNILQLSGDTSGDVSSVCYDSGRCEEGSLFVAICGNISDGHDYIPEAIKRGAKYIVHEKDIQTKPRITFIKVADSRSALGTVGKNFFRNPSADLCITGVTGTNGKTTVSYLLESIFNAAGLSVGVIGTVNYRFGGKVFPAPITTPQSLDLQKMLREMADSGVTHVILEVSSHSLDLKRVDSCEFDLGIFTNLSQEHLDYHQTMERYFLAKKIFFQEILGNGEKMIINGDDPWGQRLFEETGKNAVTFGIENKCDVSPGNFALSPDGIKGEIKTPYGNFTMNSSMIGKFNLYNILAAAAAASSLQIPEKHIRAGIENLKKVPGRLEKVSGPGQPAVFVDYAHTEDALKNVLQNLSEFRKGNIITVFGCGGDRDRGKRPLMGKAATTLSDLTIITSDNPRTEDPLMIIKEIEKGIANTIKKYPPEDLTKNFDEQGYVIIPDRKTAIELAISIAGISDIVLIAGKGHEDYQIIGDRRISFDDRTVSREALKKSA
ncbi:MAG: UDP-N-acetylmuramoyl-L-alanyl-D-glutamate--2,6-diaminopimelate ligase [Proteobacteria bacterium]|nr:UDP-N-acetylmuramoyl-L-alanyl-D-glutamate--2,6-diaminopimelate ligase [Pseudomonadota bacterium]